MDIDEEAQLLSGKEEWILQTAQVIHDLRGIDMQSCLSGARWASLWLDEFQIEYERLKPTSKSGIMNLLTSTRQNSLRRVEGVERYPNGLPSIRAIIAVKDAFCIAYGDENVRQLLI